MNKPQNPGPTHKNREEPEITQEESVPSDGPDPGGEALMKEVRNPRLDKTSEGEESK